MNDELQMMIILTQYDDVYVWQIKDKMFKNKTYHSCFQFIEDCIKKQIITVEPVEYSDNYNGLFNFSLTSKVTLNEV